MRWGKRKRFERYYSTTRGCGTGNVLREALELETCLTKMYIDCFFEEQFGQGEISTFCISFYELNGLE